MAILTKQKKRLLSYFMTLILLCSCFPGLEARAEGAYISISTAEGLNNIRNNLNGNYKLENDIDLTVYLSGKNGGWSPIGGTFSGTLDGGGHTIKGLWSTTPGSYKGLFSTTKNATVKNLNVELAPAGISGGYEVGGIVGTAQAGTVIDNVTVSGGCVTATAGGYAGGIAGFISQAGVTVSHAAVIGTTVKTSGNYAGGLVGCAYGAVITNSSAVNTLSCAYSYAGGFAGAVYGGTIIEQSYSTGNAETTGPYAGGFAGVIYGQSKVEKSYATGSVRSSYSSDAYAGGFAGAVYEQSTVQSACATGDVSASRGQIAGGFAGIIYEQSVLKKTNALGSVYSNGNYAGGLVAKVHSGSSVEQSSAYGTVTAKGYVAGGLVGEVAASGISNTYARGNVSGTTGVGGLVGYFSGNSSTASQRLTNSYSAGRVTGSGSTEVGALVGRSGVTFEGTNYYDADTASGLRGNGASGNPQGVLPQGYSTADMMKQECFIGWDFDQIWNIEEGETYPYFDFCGFTPEVVNARSKKPVIHDAWTTDKRVSGTGIANSVIDVTFVSGTVVSTTVRADGSWYAAVPDGEDLQVGDILLAAQTETGKQKSGNSESIVKERLLQTKVLKDWSSTGDKIHPGDIVEVTIVIENESTSELTWSEITLTETLNENLIYNQNSLSVESADSSTGQADGQYDSDKHRITAYLGSLQPGERATVTYRVLVGEDAAIGDDVDSHTQVSSR